MPKGELDVMGTERVRQNGYTEVKTPQGWRYKHHLVAEEKLGRKLLSTERVLFVDKDKTNFDPDNLEVVTSNAKKNKISLLQNRLDKVESEVSSIKSALSELTRD